LRPFLLSLFFSLFIFFADAFAHPVAQGSLELRLSKNEATATLRVSNEQIFVAGSLGEGATEASSFDALLTQHGAYLLRHFTILADDLALPGEVISVQPPADRSVNGFTTYTLRYPLPEQRISLEVRQDLLTEILFAPGNPWEAPLVARVWQHELDLPIVEGRLFTARQPLRLGRTSIYEVVSTTPQTAHGSLALDYFRAGLTHIAVGWDHALFVAALVLALPGFWRVVALVSVFTLAHTVTLTLSILGVIHARSSMVEPLVAASIVAAAALNIFRPATALLGGRLAVAFGFGLFHGLGFAGGLVAAMQDYSTGARAAAIGGFSIGVELGHQLVVLPLLGVLAVVRRGAPQHVATVIRVGGVVIFAAGLWLLAVTLR